MENIRIVDISTASAPSFTKHLADCVILTHDDKILLQKRPAHWGESANAVTLFGGHVEPGETTMQGVIREIGEETGAMMPEKDVIFIAALSEAWTNHKELVHVHFWHDRHHRITGCYEGEAVFFDSVKEAVETAGIMDYARWALTECQRKGLLPLSS